MANLEPMRIGRLARRTGVSIKTLRFYDSQGFLITAGRSAANYRLFPEDAIRCVNGIRTLKTAGLTIRDLRELVAAYRADGDWHILLRQKLAQVLERLDRKEAELQTTRGRLLNLLSNVQQVSCRAGTP
jgi:MerR family transcriptional regulator, copper efflux regulator